MTEDLLRAVGELTLRMDKVDDTNIDDKLSRRRPKSHTVHDPEALKRDLEAEFSTPPTAFGPEWLNRLQQ